MKIVTESSKTTRAGNVPAVRPYAVGLRGDLTGEYTTVVYAPSPGKAKYDQLLSIWDAWGRDGTWNGKPLSFAILTCRRVGEFQPLALRRTASYRGLPFVRAGMQIEVDGHRGIIVGNNESANFDVCFMEGPHRGLTLNCHPQWKTRYFDADGSVLADFMGTAV